MAITPDGIQFGGEVTLSVDDKINFGTFGINELSLKLNSLDPDYEYWKIGGKIDLATSIPGFFDSRIAGFDGSFSSYYWLPDKVTIGAALDPGITVYKVIEINQVGGELQGMSTIALDLYESVIPEKTYNIIGTGLDNTLYDKQDIILAGTAGADINLFASFNGNNALMKKFKSWGEIGEANGKVEINFSDPEFTISADLSLLGSEKAKAAAKINKDGLDVSASVELGISGFGCEVKGKADANLGGNLTGGYIKLGVNGNVDMAPANVHAKGASKLAVDWDWDFNKAKVTLNYSGNNGKEKEASIWYEDNGELFLWDKVHASSN